jgi:hypothetical protein
MKNKHTTYQKLVGKRSSHLAPNSCSSWCATGLEGMEPLGMMREVGLHLKGGLLDGCNVVGDDLELGLERGDCGEHHQEENLLEFVNSDVADLALGGGVTRRLDGCEQLGLHADKVHGKVGAGWVSRNNRSSRWRAKTHRRRGSLQPLEKRRRSHHRSCLLHRNRLRCAGRRS